MNPPLETSPCQRASADSPVVVLDGPRLPATLEGHIDYTLDASKNLMVEDVLSGSSPPFQPVTTAFPDFGYIDKHVWLRLRLQNVTEDVSIWRVHFRENFKQFMAVHVVYNDGRVDTVYNVGVTDGFDKRPIQYPEMVAPMTLDPGEAATLFINFWSEGSSHIAFGFETELSFASTAAQRTAKNFLYYGMVILPMLLAIIGFAIYRHGVFIAYVATWLTALLYVMHGDGVAFQYLWPNNPAFNSFASIPLGTLLIMLAPNFARVFLNTRVHNPYVDRMLWGVIWLAFALGVSSVGVRPCGWTV
ncbi:7TM-DISM domain-containing protein [uncultured Marivita sp.]|uniref:7TMR-DISM family protein n=1 Tax=uncultured Marivita sp. TaxID=888080 RepID=UPI00344C2706